MNEAGGVLKKMRLGRWGFVIAVVLVASMAAWVGPVSASNLQQLADASGEPGPGVVGQVLFSQKISDIAGGFTGILDVSDSFGLSVSSLGDVDGDGVPDLVVGATGDDDGDSGAGAVWVLFLHPNATVKAFQKISATLGGFTGTLTADDRFGTTVAGLGDFDGDGVPDMVVGSVFNDDGGTNKGAIWILFLHPNGTVKSHQKISATEGGFTGSLDIGDSFGSSVAPVGDLDRDGVGDLAVGARGDDDGGPERGAVWILFLNADGTVKSHQKVSATEGGFNGNVDDFDSFGFSVTALRNHGGSGPVTLAVGAIFHTSQGVSSGAVWILNLQSDGTVFGHEKIAHNSGGFTGTLVSSNWFGTGVANLGDLNCDGFADLAVGATPLVGDGQVWILFLDQDKRVIFHQKIDNFGGGTAGQIELGEFFGFSVAPVGDIDGDGNVELVVGSPSSDDGGSSKGAARVLFLDGGGCYPEAIFSDGFELGDTSAWSGVQFW